MVLSDKGLGHNRFVLKKSLMSQSFHSYGKYNRVFNVSLDSNIL